MRILTWLRNYLDYWRDDTIEALAWLVLGVVIIAIGISDPIVWDWIVSWWA